MLLTLAAGISVALFVGSLVLWVRSYWADNQLHWVLVRDSPSSARNEVYGEHVRLSSSRGKLALALMRSRTPHPSAQGATVGFDSGPAITRWSWTNDRDDLNELRKAAKKWERRYIFEYGRVVHRNPRQGALPGASQQSAYLVVWWPEVILILGLIAWPLVRAELSRRRRPWRLLHGYCVECGYNLKKSLGACPECGKGRWGLEYADERGLS
jgi:hypothetical protein